MMRRLVVTSKFQRAYRKLVKRERALKSRIDDVLRKMEADVFSPDLGTHKLSGALLGFWAFLLWLRLPHGFFAVNRPEQRA